MQQTSHTVISLEIDNKFKHRQINFAVDRNVTQDSENLLPPNSSLNIVSYSGPCLSRQMNQISIYFCQWSTAFDV
jgi:hypothetical protein